MGPFEIRVGVRIVGEGTLGGVVLDSTGPPATLEVGCFGRLVLESLDVRHSMGEDLPGHALYVRNGTVRSAI